MTTKFDLKRAQAALQDNFGRRVLLLGGLVALMWLLELFDLALWNVNLDLYGIRPRTLVGLRNILFAPWLHHGLGHLIANTVPFLLLGWFVLLRGIGEFWRVTLLIVIISGLGVWLFGAPRTLHLGLSGVIFGYLAYLLARGYFERSVQSIVLAIIAFLLYGTLLWGLLIWQPGVSWLGHTFGFVGGVFAALRYRVVYRRIEV